MAENDVNNVNGNCLAYYMATSRHPVKCLKSRDTTATHTERNSVLKHYKDWGAQYPTRSAVWLV